MTATTPQENGILRRDSIPLPIFRPISKPSATTLGVPPVPPAPAASYPQSVQPVTKLDLDLLGKGDKFVLRTANSTYNFEMDAGRRCKVIPDKPTARAGEAVLMGGTNADASEYTPDRILVGGRAAYQFPDADSAVLTSVVESIFWVAAAKPDRA